MTGIRPAWAPPLSCHCLVFVLLSTLSAPWLFAGDLPTGVTQDPAAASTHVTTMVNSLGMRMAWIPPGSFLMGAPAWDTRFGPSTKPRHWVTITSGFWMGAYEVTQRDWCRVVYGVSESPLVRNGDVALDRVGTDDAEAFLKALSALDGRPYRLPSEAEWEYACQAGGHDATYAGPLVLADDGSAPVLDDLAWYSRQNSRETAETPEERRGCGGGLLSLGSGPYPVGRKHANAYGLFDMLGNVSERCRDEFDRYFYARSPTDDPLQDDWRRGSGNQVARGGSWDLPALWSTAWQRMPPTSGRHPGVGFRVVCAVGRTPELTGSDGGRAPAWSRWEPPRPRTVERFEWGIPRRKAPPSVTEAR